MAFFASIAGSSNEHYNADCDVMVIEITPKDLQDITEVSNTCLHPRLSEVRLDFFGVYCFSRADFDELFPDVPEEWEDSFYQLPTDTAQRLEKYDQDHPDFMETCVVENREIIIQLHRVDKSQKYLFWRCNPRHDNVEIQSNQIVTLADLQKETL